MAGSVGWLARELPDPDMGSFIIMGLCPATGAKAVKNKTSKNKGKLSWISLGHFITKTQLTQCSVPTQWSMLNSES